MEGITKSGWDFLIGSLKSGHHVGLVPLAGNSQQMNNTLEDQHNTIRLVNIANAIQLASQKWQNSSAWRQY